jgi:hypothetical protein
MKPISISNIVGKTIRKLHYLLYLVLYISKKSKDEDEPRSTQSPILGVLHLLPTFL